ncbi:MAG: AsmA family protein [Azospirillum sp.]|nr:AsmA family protein [Azospirillum sp.]
MTRRLRRLVWLVEIAASVMLACAAVVGVLLWYVNANDYRREVIAAVEDTTGLIVAIDGKVNFSLRPIPTLIANQVRVANAPWAQSAEMASIARVEIGFSPTSLLFGRPRIAHLGLAGAVIRLESDRLGRANWWWSAGGSSIGTGVQQPWAPDIAKLTLKDVLISYHSGGNARPTTIAVVEGKAQLPRAGRLTLDVTGHYRDVPVAVDLTGGPLIDVIADRPAWPIDATVRGAGTTLELRGTIDHPLGAGRKLDLAVGVIGKRLGAINPLIGLWLPGIGPYRATARMTGGTGHYRFDDIAAQFARSDLGGSLTLQLGGARPRVDGRLTSTTLRLADLSGDVVRLPPVDDRRVFSDWPYPFDALGAIDGRVDLAFDRVVTWPGELTKLDGVAHLSGRLLTVDPFQARLTGGTIDGRVDIDARPRPTRLYWTGKASSLDLALLMPAFGWSEPPTGQLDIAADLAARGESIRALFAGVDGEADFVVGKGTLPIRGFDLIAADLVQALLPWAEHGDRTQLNCLVARFQAHNGLATSQGLLIDTGRITISGAGAINLATEQLDMLFNPRPKDPSLISLATPMRMTGTLYQHYTTPDALGLAARGAAGLLLGAINPLALLVPFVSIGTGSANPCVQALHPPATSQAVSPRGPVGNALDYVDKLGRSLLRPLWVKPW